MNEMRFSRLWSTSVRPATENWTPFRTDEEARKYRDAAYYMFRKQGKKVSRSSLTGQMRKYWSMGVPCGDSCTVYYLTVSDS